jgi:hypothetical protein
MAEPVQIIEVVRVGDKVRSLDFSGPIATRDDCYVEGVVEAIGDFPQFPDCARYRIRCTRRVFGGKEVVPEADLFFPPVNGTPTLLGGVCDGVRLVGGPAEVTDGREG